VGQPSPERLQVETMLSEGGGVPTDTADAPVGAPLSAAPAEEMSTSPVPKSWAAQVAGRWAQDVGYRYLSRLAHARGRVSESMGLFVAHSHRRAEQTRLALELIDDFKDGTYRDVSWISVTALAGSLLYIVEPSDVVPSFLPGLGWLDELAVLALAIRIARSDLLAYCRFKGYREADFFPERDRAQA
jgi:uncharacterized membrane protein YkvA (DUF1232 family)